MRRMPSVVAVASSLVLLGAAAPAAEAAPYLASCNSGVLAPQICTFAASSVVAAFAAPGQHLVLTRRALSFPPGPCPNGARGNTEEYRGVLRGAAGVEEVTLLLSACPGEHPFVLARTDDTAEYSAELSVRPPESGGAASVLFLDGGRQARIVSDAIGPLFRRDTGMSSYMSGHTDECDHRNANGLCEMGGSREHAYSARLDSSISGRWARLQLAISAEHPEVPSRTVRVTSAPYGNGGWKITRVA